MASTLLSCRLGIARRPLRVTGTAGRRRFQRVCTAASSPLGDDLFDAYDVLGVPDDADSDEIRTAFLALQKRFHPDVYRGDEAKTRSAEINRAYDVLTSSQSRVELDDALLRINGGQRRVRRTFDAPGIVGPMREKFLLRLVACGGDVDEMHGGGRLCDVDTMPQLTEAIREWGKMIAFTSEMPLPLPLQCDDIEGGLRLAFITFDDGRIKEVGALNITVELVSRDEGRAVIDAEGGYSTASTRDDALIEVRVCRSWAGRDSVASEPLPGESRILANFTDEFAFLMDSGLRGEVSDENEGNALMKGLKGFASNIASFALPVLPLFGSARGVTPGGSYNAYRIIRSRSSSSDESLDEGDVP